MNWLDSMNTALEYIEENLNIRINYEIVAAKAVCSFYNFQRMFSFITGVSLAAYVRRRCITLAAQELAKSDISVIEVALKYGYDSPISFARAFHSIQEMTPVEAKKEGAESKGVRGIQDIFKRMYTEWFPTSEYEHADGPELEWYSTDDMNSPDYRCEVWVPIIPLKK